MLTSEQILAAHDFAIENVDVPKWGGTVCIREMTGIDRERWEREAFGEKGTAPENDHHRALLVAYCLCDEAGVRLFPAGQVATLAGKGARTILRLYKIAMRVNGLRAEDVEDEAKNS